jgi:chitinase
LHPNLNVLISIGAASAANTAAFVTAASNIAPGITAPGLFDGINIDWEFPTASDTQNFTALLTEFRNQLNQLSALTGKHYILTFNGPAGAQNYVTIKLPQAAAQALYVDARGLGGAYVWALKDDDANGTMVKILTAFPGY